MLHANVDPDLPVHVFSHCITGVTPMLKYLVSSHPNSFCSLSDSAFGGVSHRHVKQIQMSFKHSNPLFSSQGGKPEVSMFSVDHDLLLPSPPPGAKYIPQEL